MKQTPEARQLLSLLVATSVHEQPMSLYEQQGEPKRRDVLQKPASCLHGAPSLIYFCIVRKHIKKKEGKCAYQIYPGAGARRQESKAACVLPPWFLSDCSLSFCLPATRMRRDNKSFLNLGLWCHFFFSPPFLICPILSYRGKRKLLQAYMRRSTCARTKRTNLFRSLRPPDAPENQPPSSNGF